ncbi:MULTISPECIES: hypothetical protein [Achromobacter]|uniref:hypothetical protein n=1 Tax=Achromobacter TaxID=222 RepID=UPI00257B9F04|nr:MULTISPECIES: hypothetical protein [Achromobacter]
MELLQQCFVQVLVKAPRTNAENSMVLRQGGEGGAVVGCGAVSVRLQVFSPLHFLLDESGVLATAWANHSGR